MAINAARSHFPLEGDGGGDAVWLKKMQSLKQKIVLCLGTDSKQQQGPTRQSQAVWRRGPGAFALRRVWPLTRTCAKLSENEGSCFASFAPG